MTLPWLRLYADAVDDEKLRLLAYEDRWHFIAILCLKQQGILDTKPGLRERKIAVKLGLQMAELDEVKRRLMEVELIQDDWNPVAWNKRQFQSDSSADRVRKYRENKKKKECNGDVTLQKRSCNVLDTDTDTDTDTDKEQKHVRKPDHRKARETIIQHLNLKTGARFQPHSKNSKQKIDARLNSGATVEDCISVVNSRCAKWINDPKMHEYLRPETLFGSKFCGYLATAHMKPPDKPLTPDDAMRKLQEQQHGFNNSHHDNRQPLLGVSHCVGSEVQGRDRADPTVEGKMGADIVQLLTGSGDKSV